MEEEQIKAFEAFVDIEVGELLRQEQAVVVAHHGVGRGLAQAISFADPHINLDSMALYNEERARGLVPGMVRFPEELAGKMVTVTGSALGGDPCKKKTKPKKKRATPSPLLKNLLKGIKK